MQPLPTTYQQQPAYQTPGAYAPAPGQPYQQQPTYQPQPQQPYQQAPSQQEQQAALSAWFQSIDKDHSGELDASKHMHEGLLSGMPPFPFFAGCHAPSVARSDVNTYLYTLAEELQAALRLGNLDFVSGAPRLLFDSEYVGLQGSMRGPSVHAIVTVWWAVTVASSACARQLHHVHALHMQGLNDVDAMVRAFDTTGRRQLNLQEFGKLHGFLTSVQNSFMVSMRAYGPV